ncbi:MAG: lysine exporter LysO family protein [Firmicutes bacterium]|nr:lysine exporter LysO family protein [Bacillota bacterium]
MKLLLIYWAFLIIGYAAGSGLRRAEKHVGSLPACMMVTVYCLCFVMGLRMGVNEQVTSNLGVIGLQALVITFFCITGSMLAIFGARRILRMDRYGDRILPEDCTVRRPEGRGADRELDRGAAASGGTGRKEPGGSQPEDAEGTQPEDGSGLDVRSTLILLSVVAAGMLIGAFILARRGEVFLFWFDGASNMTMVVVLCVLMFLVGLDMGYSGNAIENLRTAGVKMLIFPVATMVGTMVFGIGACLILGFTLRESAAIPIGFGWYSYAPIVIAGAGQQYIVASAVSFMHNVIREVSGIILIPVAAKKFGYLEATSIPGIAAMDVCMPIVGRACREDTMIYSFSIGLIMCVVTSVGVPLIMGV